MRQHYLMCVCVCVCVFFPWMKKSNACEKRACAYLPICDISEGGTKLMLSCLQLKCMFALMLFHIYLVYWCLYICMWMFQNVYYIFSYLFPDLLADTLTMKVLKRTAAVHGLRKRVQTTTGMWRQYPKAKLQDHLYHLFWAVVWHSHSYHHLRVKM